MTSTIILDLETTGLHAMFDRILCIVTYNEAKIMQIFCNEDEKQILENFWSEYDGETICGYNIDGFDIGFLIKRSIINNVKVKKIPKSIDLRKVVNSFYISYSKYEKGKLSDWAKVLGMEVETLPGEYMKELYEKGDWEGIKNHNIEDVEITYQLFLRCKETLVL